MVNAQEWLDTNIVAKQREHVITLQIQQRVHCTNNDTNYANRYQGWRPCDICSNGRQITGQNYQFYNVLLEGNLDLSNLINLEQLTIQGISQEENKQQLLTDLNISKCIKLDSLNVIYTTLTNLNISKNNTLQHLNCCYNRLTSLNLTNKRFLQTFNCTGNQITNLELNDISLEVELKEEREQVQSQFKKLVGMVKLNEDYNQLKSKVKEIEAENLTYQLTKRKNELKKIIQDIKDKLSEDCQELLEILLGTQREILKNAGNSFARKQLERTKMVLVKKLSVEEIEILLGKLVEINELENQLNNLEIQEQISTQETQIQIPPK